MAAGKMSPADRKAARASAETAAMSEVRHAAEKQREKSEKLKQLRLDRDAAAPAKKKAVRKPPVSDLNSRSRNGSRRNRLRRFRQRRDALESLLINREGCG